MNDKEQELTEVMVHGGRLTTDIGKTQENPLQLRMTPKGTDAHYEQRGFYGEVAFVEIDGEVRELGNVDAGQRMTTQLWVDTHGRITWLCSAGVWLHDAT
jgi:hypothetical protein